MIIFRANNNNLPLTTNNLKWKAPLLHLSISTLAFAPCILGADLIAGRHITRHVK